MNNFDVAIDPAIFDSFVKLSEGLGELEVVIGPVARPVVSELRNRLTEAAVRQKSGDTAGALALIRGAMERLASLTGTLDPAEAMLMRVLSEQFSNARSIGDKNAATGAMKVMRHKAGDPNDEPNTDW